MLILQWAMFMCRFSPLFGYVSDCALSCGIFFHWGRQWFILSIRWRCAQRYCWVAFLCLLLCFGLFCYALMFFCAFYVFMKSKELVDEGADAIFFCFFCAVGFYWLHVFVHNTWLLFAMTSSSVLLKFLSPSTPPQKNSGAFKVPPWQH